MAITIQSVDLHSKKAIEQFLHLPWNIYVTPDGTRDPHWVPPFLPDQRSLLHPHKNPYHQHSWTQLFIEEGAGGWLPQVGSAFLVMLVLVMACSLVAASASYYLVERPILKFKDPRPPTAPPSPPEAERVELARAV